MKKANNLKVIDFLEYLYKEYNKKDYIETDPIRFPHELKGNKEFIAFTSASFAYGNMKAIQKFLYAYFNHAGTEPESLNLSIDSKLYYRFQTKEDILAYSTLMQKVYNKYGSLGNLFYKAGASSIKDIDKGIILLRSYIDNMTKGLNFLLPVPGKSASKRLYMFLRWMVRKDDIDFGLWNHFDIKSLYMPADTHILRMAYNINIIGENEKGSKAVKKVTNFFKSLNEEDPAKYDFSLTRLGIISSCKYMKSDICSSCRHRQICLFY